MASSSTETGQQSQKLVLRVSVDCEGCRKKVTKILHSITGVESCDVDIKQQRVVVTGNVDADTVIAKLVKKTGKHAELWPEQKIQRKKKSREKHRRESDGAPSDRAEEHGSRGSDETKENGNSETAEGGEDEDDVEEDRQPEKKATAEGLEEPPSAEAMEKNVNDGNKKQSKGRIGNEKNQHRVENPPIEDNQPPPPNNIPPRHPEVNRQLNSTQSSVAPNHVPPRHPYPSTSPHAKITCGTGTSAPYPQPPPSYNHLKPIFTVSYNAAPQPQTSLSTTHPPLNAAPHSYLARPLPSYYYSHQHPQPAYTMNYNAAPQPQANRSATQPFNSAGYRPSNYYSDYHRSYDDQVDYDAYRQQPESLGMFSDENPNACLIM